MKKRNLIPTEEEEQILLATWLMKQGIKFYAIPNGGYRNYFEAIKLKRCGVKAGVPDICIPKPSGDYHGLYIELKRALGGKTSSTQKEWINVLRENGYWADVANGFQEAKEIVEYYFSLDKKQIGRKNL